jgi:hypothetical protein
MSFVQRHMDSFRAWRERRRDDKVLSPIYDLTWGYSDGITFARKRQKKGVQLQSFTQGRTGRTATTSTLIGLIPVPNFILSAYRADAVYKHMARSAWAISHYLGHAPTYQRDAAYDLVAITTLWAKRKATKKALSDFTATALQDGINGQIFGKATLLHLVRQGVAKTVKRRHIERMYASRPFQNQVKKYIKPITDEMREAVLYGIGVDAVEFDALWADYIPVVSRVWGAGKDTRKIHTFQVVAIEYYTAKQKVEDIHGRPEL